MSFSPHYAEFENQPRPSHCWTNPEGFWIGIWGLDWGDILLKCLVDFYQEYDCEIWQPDIRADKIYTAQLQDRLVHRNFPAVVKKTFRGCRVTEEIYSKSIIDYMKNQDKNVTVFMVPAAVGLKWFDDIVAKISASNIVYYHLQNADLLLPEPVNTMNPFKIANRLMIKYRKYARLKKIRVLLTPNTNPSALSKIRRLNPQLRVCDLIWGLDLDFWKPVTSKDEARTKLEIPNTAFVIVLSQRLVPEYQLDKFIEAVARINTDRKFVCYVTGHGSRDYEAYLKELTSAKDLDGVINFVGFVSDEELRSYLIAADLFATYATKSAGSGGAFKAMAIGTPILLTTTTGGTYLYLLEHQAGEYLDPHDYNEWTRKMKLIIEGKEVKSVPRECIINNASWRSTADSLHNAFTSKD